jgi:hypothetical protein
MSTKSNEDLVKLERALLVQMSARKYYSNITELDEQQAQHLRKIDSTIGKLKGKRDELAPRESIYGRSVPSEVPSEVPNFLHDWISQGTERQSEQRTTISKRSFLDLEDCKEPSTKKRNIFLIVGVLLLIAAGAIVGIYFATKKGAQDASLASSTGVELTPSSNPAPTSSSDSKSPSPSTVPVPVPQTASKNLLRNGDFSKNACPGSTTNCVSELSDTISPWKLTSPDMQYEINPAGHYPFAPDALTMDLNSSGDNGAYTIQQTITTLASTKYRISFSLNASPCRPSLKSGFVLASGTGQVNFTSTKTDPTQSFTYDFAAAGASTDISIGSTTPGSCGPVIFNVQVVQI